MGFNAHIISVYIKIVFFQITCTSQSLKICLHSSRTSREVAISEYLGVHTDVVEVFNLLEYGFTSLSNWCPAFRENLMVSSSRVEMPKENWELRTLNLSPLFVSQLQVPSLRRMETSCSYLPSFRGTYCLHLQYWKVLKFGCIMWVPPEHSNIYPTRCNVTQFILSGNCSTCFGWYHHPSSGGQTPVSTGSGICQTVTATCCYSGR